jgi:16S rRNA processing protein RimM
MGRVAGAYGVHGWIRVRPYSEAPDALVEHSAWKIAGADRRIVEARLHSGSVIARVEGVDGRDAAEALKGAVIELRRGSLPEPEEGRYYWADLVGSRVENSRGEVLGIVAGLRSNGAHELLEVTGERERLIPWLPQFVKDVDVDGERIIVDWERDW